MSSGSKFYFPENSHSNISHPFQNLDIPLLKDGIYFPSLGRTRWPPLEKTVAEAMLPDFQG